MLSMLRTKLLQIIARNDSTFHYYALWMNPLSGSSILFYLVFFCCCCTYFELDQLLLGYYRLRISFPFLIWLGCDNFLTRFFCYGVVIVLLCLPYWGFLLIRRLPANTFSPLQETVLTFVFLPLMTLLLSLPTVSKLVFRYTNFQFYVNGQISNILWESFLFKLNIYPQNMKEFTTNLILKMSADFHAVREAFRSNENFKVEFLNMLLSDKDFIQANNLLQELKSFHGPFLPALDTTQLIVVEPFISPVIQLFFTLVCLGFLIWLEGKS
jgi:hypothetical protein